MITCSAVVVFVFAPTAVRRPVAPPVHRFARTIVAGEFVLLASTVLLLIRQVHTLRLPVADVLLRHTATVAARELQLSAVCIIL